MKSIWKSSCIQVITIAGMLLAVFAGRCLPTHPVLVHDGRSESTSQASVGTDVKRTVKSLINSAANIDDTSAINESEEGIQKILEVSHLPLPTDWSPDARKHFLSVVSNAREIKEVIPPLKNALVRSKLSDSTKKDRTEFYRFRREWQRLLVQNQARVNQFLVALDTVKEKKRLAEMERRRYEDLGVTREAYKRIHDGMHEYQVQAVIGYACMREEQSSAGSLKTYAWQDGFSTIIATFEDHRLIAKAQSGL